MKEIIKTKSIEIAKFETLDSNINNILKRGFSVVYNEMFHSAGKKAPVNNAAFGCDCSTLLNMVAGCGCP